MRKLLILLIFFLSTAVAEPQRYIETDEGIVENVLVTFVFYDNYRLLNKAFPKYAPIEGISICERHIEKNIAYCEIHQVLPSRIDDKHTLTMGHEVAHGVFGLYHK